MKRILIGLFAISLLSPFFTQAQTKVVFTAGTIISKTVMPTLDAVENTVMLQIRQPGAFAGIDVRATDNQIFTQFGLAYAMYNSSNVDVEGLSISKALNPADRMQVVKAKILIGHSIVPKNKYANVYLNAGVRPSYIFSHNNEESVLDLDEIQRLNVSGSLGAGVDFFHRLNIELQYELSFAGYILKETDSLKSYSISIGFIL